MLESFSQLYEWMGSKHLGSDDIRVVFVCRNQKIRQEVGEALRLDHRRFVRGDAPQRIFAGSFYGIHFEIAAAPKPEPDVQVMLDAG